MIQRCLTVLLAGSTALVLASCGENNNNTDGGTDLPSVNCPTFGDIDKDIEIEIGQLEEGGGFRPLNDGDTLSIRFPPQGGQVSFVGVRITNSKCDIAIKAELIDKQTNIQIQKEERSLRITNESAERPGWGEPDTDIASYANIPLCPNFTIREFLNVESILEVIVTDRATNHRVTKRITVIPRCNEMIGPLAESHRTLCECECQPGYTLGKCAEGGGGDGGTEAEMMSMAD